MRTLKLKVRELSLREFGLFPDIPISINSRLKKTLGRLVYKKINGNCIPMKLEFSPSILEDTALLEKTILHELSHWYLMIEGKNFGHGSEDFKKLSTSLDFPIFQNISSVPAHYWKCSHCERIVAVNFKKVDYSSSRTFCCNSKLEYMGFGKTEDFE